MALPQRGLKTLFHQELVEQDCIASHSDHLGPRLAQRSRKPFSHALLRPAVQDRCDSCHEHPPASIRRKHEKEGIPDFENCTECHRDPGVEPDKPGKGRSGHKGEKD